MKAYIKLCELTLERSQITYEWSRVLYNDDLRPRAQMMADKLKFERDQDALREGKLEWERLIKHSGSKHIHELQAKQQAITVDELALEGAYQLEKNKLDRFDRNIAACKMLAPRDGIVVYANASNSWGRSMVQIQEGTTVREGMPIFNVPDPTHMRVKATINETKMAIIQTGMNAIVRIDAFPGRPLVGKVAQITPIPSLTAGPMSDVKIYYAMVDIEGEFPGLRPGMSTSILFEVEQAIQGDPDSGEFGALGRRRPARRRAERSRRLRLEDGQARYDERRLRRSCFRTRTGRENRRRSQPLAGAAGAASAAENLRSHRAGRRRRALIVAEIDRLAS